MKEVQLKTFSNSWFDTGRNKLVLLLWYFTNIVFFINPVNVSSMLKVYLLRLFGAKVGKGVLIKPSVNIKYPWKLTIGNDVWIGENVWIDNLTNVVIESDVCISQGAMLLTGNHDYKSTTFDLIVGAITIKKGAWVGAKTVVCPGVTVGSHAILSVNSVANKDLEPYQIYQGNPAIKIRTRIVA